MTISCLIDALQAILDRQGDVDVRIGPFSDTINSIQCHDGYDESANDGGWDHGHVQLS